MSIQVGRYRVWFYTGRSFDTKRIVQRQRVSSRAGYVQLAYGNIVHYGRAARRTVGVQLISDAGQ